MPAPSELLDTAVKKVPVVKYALGVAGVVSAVAVIAGFKTDWRIAIFGTVVMFVFMAILLIFTSMARLKSSSMALPATVLVWFSTVLFVASASCLFTWIVADWPTGLAGILDPALRPNAKPGTGLLTGASVPSPLNRKSDKEQEAHPPRPTPDTDPPTAQTQLDPAPTQAHATTQPSARQERIEILKRLQGSPWRLTNQKNVLFYTVIFNPDFTCRAIERPGSIAPEASSCDYVLHEDSLTIATGPLGKYVFQTNADSFFPGTENIGPVAGPGSRDEIVDVVLTPQR